MSPYDPETVTFLVAGPVRIHPRVLRAMSTPSLNHRGEYFHGIVQEIRELLPVLFGTTGRQVVLTGSGTSGLEAVYSSLLRRSEPTLVLTNGNFGDRTDQIARRYCDAVTTISAPWGTALPLEEVRAALEGQRFRAVCVVHNETSVGLANDLATIAPWVRANGALFLVDGISAVGGIPLPIRDWGVDAVVAGSQKGLAAPAGLAMVHLSERAVGELGAGTFYLDLKAHLASLEKNDTPFTPAVPLFLALREALSILKEEGLAGRLERTRRLAEACRAGVDALGLELLPDRRHASDTVTAIRNPEGMDDKSLRGALLQEYHVALQGGQGPLKGKIFRIGHMGIADWPDLLVTFAALERLLARHGRSVSPGRALAAVSAGMP